MKPQLHLSKYHGLGNDFLVALDADNPGITPDSATARALCARRRGVGADGVLYGLPAGGPGADAHMVLLNSDGSEAEISGNGIRCLAQALLRREGRNEADLVIETAGGSRQVRTVRGDVDRQVWMQVDMGVPTDGPALTTTVQAYGAKMATTIDIGNPHLVLLVADPDSVDLTTDGPRLEADFPAGINVHFIAVEAPERVRLRVWERGAGVTEACGSGAVAAAVAAGEWGLVGSHVNVVMPGGEAVVDVTEAAALLTGPSTFVAEVVIP